jgi:hypothetical protein
VSLVSRSSWPPANDNGPCSTPVLASRQRIGGIKPPTIVATAAPANDNRVNIAVHRDSGSSKQISASSARDRSAGPHFYILKEVASALRKSELRLWNWLVWLLQRLRVVEFTKDKAVIEAPFPAAGTTNPLWGRSATAWTILRRGTFAADEVGP